MSNQQKADEFWGKLIKAVTEIQNDFSKLDSQEKQVIMERINKVLQMQGIAISMDAFLNCLRNFRY